MSADVEIKGLKEVQAKMEQMVRDTRGAPMVQAMKDATLLVEREAKIRAPVDTGRLRASITPSVTQNPLQGVVGSNVFYAPYQELGTGRLRPKRYLQGALEANLEKIKALFEKVMGRIVNK